MLQVPPELQELQVRAGLPVPQVRSGRQVCCLLLLLNFSFKFHIHHHATAHTM